MERNYAIFPTGRIVRSSRLRLKISRVSPIPDLFKNRLSILARETCRSEKVFLRESGREEKREAWFQVVPSRFSKVLRENIPSNEEGDDATISRTSRSKALTRSSFFPFLRSFDCRIKKGRKKERKRRKEAKFSVERRRTGRNGAEIRAVSRLWLSSRSMAHSIRVEIQWTSGGHR